MRRGFSAAVALFVCMYISMPSQAWSKIYIDITGPSGRRLPIAVQSFMDMGTGSDYAQKVDPVAEELRNTLIGDLRFSGLFDVIEEDAYLEPGEEWFSAANINFRNWRTAGAEALVKGRLRIEGERLVVEIKLFDTVKESRLIGKRYTGRTSNPRRIAHRFADDLMEELTGRRGIFSTKLLFVSDRTGNKEIYISDYDGRNVKQITRNGSINISPRWSPDGKKILYTSYKKGWPCVHMLDLRSGRETVVSDRPGINIGGRFSPDGTKIALTLSIDGSPELYLLDMTTGGLKRLTKNYGIDVSPAWSPDGSKIAFVSDMAGNPHIYIIDPDGSNLRRLTYDGKYNASPSWSPDGRFIAFARMMDDKRFDIWVMRSDGSGQRRLTYEGMNKSPFWSPDGRFIAFSSRRGGNGSAIYIMRANGEGITKVTGDGDDAKSPAWSPYLE